MANLLHFANTLYLVSYSVRDILWLRILTVAGMCFCVPYYLNRPEPDWPPVFWQLVFAAVNMVQIGILLRERMPIQLSVDEAVLHVGPFRSMTPRQVRHLVENGSWEQIPAGAKIVAEGEDLDRLILLHSGTAEVRSGQETIATLRGGQFVGEMSFLSQQGASADVYASESVRCLTWSDGWLEGPGRASELQVALRSALGLDLVGKLRQMASN